jgi:hypothetical protein
MKDFPESIVQELSELNHQFTGFGQTIIVSGMEESDRAVFMESALFRDWISSVELGLKVLHIKLEALVRVPYDAPPASAYITAFFSDVYEKEWIQSVLISGEEVLVLVILSAQEEEYVVAIEQPQISTGEARSLGFLCGVWSGDALSSAVIALQEIDIAVFSEDLIDLSKECGSADGFYISPDLMSQRCQFYAVELEMTAGEFEKFRSQPTGPTKDGEKRTRVLTLNEALLSMDDGRARLALLMYRLYQRQSRHCLRAVTSLREE